MKIWLRPEVVPAALVVAAIIGGGIASPYFWDLKYLLSESSLFVEGGILALGMTLVIITGHIDLSVASILALVAVLEGLLLAKGIAFPIAILAAIAMGALLGAVNGLMVSTLKLPSFIVTLGTMAFYRGIAQVILGPNSVKIPGAFTGVDMRHLFGSPIPYPIVIFALLALGASALLGRSIYGRQLVAVGTGERAAYLSGIPAARVIGTAFVLSGALAGVAASLINSRLGVARYDAAQGLELDVITAVVLGGTAISGGSGSILGTVLALALIGLVRTGMGLANVTAEYQLSAIGVLLIVAVMLGRWVDERSKRRVLSE